MSLDHQPSFGLPQSAINAIQLVFAKHPEIEKVILFGSRAMGNYRTGSDIDLCIIAPSFSLQKLFALDHEIDDLLLPWKIDLLLAHQIDNAALLDHIKRVGLDFYVA